MTVSLSSLGSFRVSSPRDRDLDSFLRDRGRVSSPRDRDLDSFLLDRDLAEDRFSRRDRGLAEDLVRDRRQDGRRHSHRLSRRACSPWIPALSGGACSDMCIYGWITDSSSGHGWYSSAGTRWQAGDGPVSDGYISGSIWTGSRHLHASESGESCQTGLCPV